MPELTGLRIAKDKGEKIIACCEDSGCKAGLPSRGSFMWLNVDSDIVSVSGARCDCVFVRVEGERNDVVCVYAIEIKNISDIEKAGTDALNRDRLLQKFERGFRIASKMLSVLGISPNRRYCILVVPGEVYNAISSWYPRIRRVFINKFDGMWISACNTNILKRLIY